MRIFQGGSNRYILVPEVAPISDADTWEFQTEFNYSGANTAVIFSSESQYHDSNMWSSYYGYQGYKVPHFYINDTYNRNLILQISTNGTSWSTTVTHNTALDAYEKYRSKCGFDGTNYYIKQQKYYDGSNPLVSSNGTMGGSTPACSCSAYNSSNWNAWSAFNGNWYGWRWSWSVDSWITYYTPNPIPPTGISIRNYNNGNNFKKAIFQGSMDNSNWTDIQELNNVNSDDTETYWEIKCIKSFKYFRLLMKEKYGSDYNCCIRRIKIFGFDESYWEDWRTVTVANSNKCIWSRPFILFNRFDSLGELYLTGWSANEGDKNGINLSYTKLTYTKDNVSKEWFSGDNFSDLGIFNFGCNINEFKIVTGFDQLHYLCTNHKMNDGENSKNQKWIFRVYTSSVEITQQLYMEPSSYALGLRGGFWNIWFNGHNYMGSKPKADTWYWIGIECDNDDYRIYTMEDTDQYYLSILPNFPEIIIDSEGNKKLEPSDWNFEFRLNSKGRETFNTQLMYFGYNPESTGEYWRGKIDLKSCLIGSNMIRAILTKPTYFPARVYLDTSNLNSIEYINMIPASEGATLTIEPTPSNADVVLTSKGSIQYDNSILVKPGAEIKYYITATNYFDEQGVITCDENTTLPIVMDAKTSVNVEATSSQSNNGKLDITNALSDPISGNVPYSVELMFRLPYKQLDSNSFYDISYYLYYGGSYYNSLQYRLYHSGSNSHTHSIYWSLPSNSNSYLIDHYEIINEPELNVDYRVKLFSDDGIIHRFAYRITDRTKYWTEGIAVNSGISYWFANPYEFISNGNNSSNQGFKLYIDMCKINVNNTSIFDGSTAVLGTDYTLTNCSVPSTESVII